MSVIYFSYQIDTNIISHPGMTPVQLSNHDIDVMINTTKLHMQVNGIGTALLKKGKFNLFYHMVYVII